MTVKTLCVDELIATMGPPQQRVAASCQSSQIVCSWLERFTCREGDELYPMDVRWAYIKSILLFGGQLMVVARHFHTTIYHASISLNPVMKRFMLRRALILS